MACGSSDDKVLADDLKKTKELAISLLKDKKSLLLSLQKERKTARKREQECKELLRQVGERESVAYSHSACSSLETLDDTPDESPSNSHLECQKENATLLQKITTSEQDIRKARAEIRELEHHKVVLEAEVMRLAESLNKTAVVSLGEGLLQEQLQIYEEDFKKEKCEKQAAEGRVVSLEGTVKDYQDLISTLTREVDMYKSAYEREKRDKECALFHVAGASALAASVSHPQPEYSAPGTGGYSVAPSHPLQVVYPVVDTGKKERNQRRKQQLNKVGVFARNSNATDGLFHGGKAEVDSA